MQIWRSNVWKCMWSLSSGKIYIPCRSRIMWWVSWKFSLWRRESSQAKQRLLVIISQLYKSFYVFEFKGLLRRIKWKYYWREPLPRVLWKRVFRIFVLLMWYCWRTQIRKGERQWLHKMHQELDKCIKNAWFWTTYLNLHLHFDYH